MIKNKKLTCFLVLMIFLCSFISYKAGKNSTAVTVQNTNSGATADYGSFKSFVDAIKEKYYFDIDYEKMNTEIKKAIFSSLGDPYTQYMTEKDMKELQKTSTGKFIGIGVQVSVNENGEVVVVAPIKGGPSQKAGIQAEDIIVKVNDEEVKKMI
ncbi:S41 family peptidase [Parvimonas micra]